MPVTVLTNPAADSSAADQARSLWLRAFRAGSARWSRVLEELETTLACGQPLDTKVLIDLARRCADASEAVETELAHLRARTRFPAGCLAEASAEQAAMAELQDELMSRRGFTRVAVELLTDARAELRCRHDQFDQLCAAMDDRPASDWRGLPDLSRPLLAAAESALAQLITAATRDSGLRPQPQATRHRSRTPSPPIRHP